jgi:hypothetical protein
MCPKLLDQHSQCTLQTAVEQPIQVIPPAQLSQYLDVTQTPTYTPSAHSQLPLNNQHQYLNPESNGSALSCEHTPTSTCHIATGGTTSTITTLPMSTHGHSTDARTINHTPIVQYPVVTVLQIPTVNDIHPVTNNSQMPVM